MIAIVDGIKRYFEFSVYGSNETHSGRTIIAGTTTRDWTEISKSLEEHQSDYNFVFAIANELTAEEHGS